MPIAETLPSLTADQMREVDRVMVEELHITLVQMMENAGRNLADLAVRLFAPTRVTILAGSGGNGGGGLVASRHLANRGCSTFVVLARARESLREVTADQLHILERMGLHVGHEPVAADLIIDAVLGYSLRGNPAGRAAELIRWANESRSPILSLDCPSGLDVTTGQPAYPCVHATATLTLALPKTGLLKASEVGDLHLADISVPPAVYRQFGFEVSPQLFADASIVSIGGTTREPPDRTP